MSYEELVETLKIFEKKGFEGIWELVFTKGSTDIEAYLNPLFKKEILLEFVNSLQYKTPSKAEESAKKVRLLMSLFDEIKRNNYLFSHSMFRYVEEIYALFSKYNLHNCDLNFGSYVQKSHARKILESFVDKLKEEISKNIKG
ncbi:MAG: hypothetical protein QW451_02395 [Candidatus Aenigmatarchaeota archaeon]